MKWPNSIRLRSEHVRGTPSKVHRLVVAEVLSASPFIPIAKGGGSGGSCGIAHGNLTKFGKGASPCCARGLDRKRKLRPPSGLEALRRLVRRQDPLSGGQRRAVLRQLTVPDRCKLHDLPAELEKWQGLVRR